ncbi:MAG: 16S rRNA processing protein RimM [Acidobacteria bacterium]|nr:16S rRNA processing protein RimM [Acidobacteriota bacterium]
MNDPLQIPAPAGAPAAAGTVALAKVRRPWGRAGELLLELHTDWPERRFAPGTVLTIELSGGRTRAARVSGYRALQQGPLLALEGVDDIGAAREFAGGLVVAPADSLERPDDADLLQADLPGMAVLDRGRRVGEVVGLEEGAAADLLVVRLDAGGEALVPFTPAICVAVDRGGRRIEIEAPPGLLDLDQADEVRPLAGTRARRA